LNKELLSAVQSVSKEKNVEPEVVFDALRASLVSACKRHWGFSNFEVQLNEETGDIKVITRKKVVTQVNDDRYEIDSIEAKLFCEDPVVGETIEIEITPNHFGRIAAQTAKQVVLQKFLELERDTIFQTMSDKKHKVTVGIIQSFEGNNIIINLGNLEVVLLEREQIAGEKFKLHDRIKVYVLDVRRHPKGVAVLVSRSHPNFVRALFAQEIPEISSGIVKIVSISREAGKRCKVAVMSENPEIEAIGACIGERGCRINIISRELGPEKVDLINWHEDIHEYIKCSLSPARVNYVRLNISKTRALVIVDDNQISLAIGKSGQNVRLASKLTGMRLDVKTEGQIEENLDALGEYFYESEENANPEGED